MFTYIQKYVSVLYMERKMHKTKQTTSDGKVKASINIDPKVLDEIDKDRKEKGMTRSGWITVASLNYLKEKRKTEKD